MIEVPINDSMLLAARDKAVEMGKLRNSITSGDGNLAGFVGEMIAQQVLGGEITNTYDYDIVLPDGTKVDVKSKRTSVAPLPHYDCSVAAYNTKQDCDYYCFVRVQNNFARGWFLGVYPKAKYFEDARYLKAGQVDPANNFTVKANCYNMAIQDLQQTP